VIRTAKKIYCDNEHGVGDVFFPDSGDYVNGPSIREIRRKAKAAGWIRTRRNDFCPDCAFDYLDMAEEEKEARRIALEGEVR
jgi:hypothetical protein